MYNYIALQGERTMVKEIATRNEIYYMQVASIVALSYSYVIRL